MPESIADKILDDAIEHEVAVRRVIGGAQRTAAQLHIDLEKKIRALLLEMNPTTEAQQARFMKKVRSMAAEAYRSQNTTSKATLRKVARAENDAVNGSIEELLNGG